MNRNSCLKEDILPKRISVRLSNEIVERIEDIDWCNRNNIEGISQLHDYIDGMTMWISNTSIAWDNTNDFQHYPDGSTHIKTNGYDVIYTIKTNKRKNQSYLYVFRIGINLEEFGLNAPSLLWENCNSKRVYHITDSQLRSIITETIMGYLLSV